MDYLALKIPADMEQPITSHIQKDLTPPEEGRGYPFKVRRERMNCVAVT